MVKGKRLDVFLIKALELYVEHLRLLDEDKYLSALRLQEMRLFPGLLADAVRVSLTKDHGAGASNPPPCCGLNSKQ